MLWSWLLRKTSAATLATLATLFVADIAIPIIFNSWIPLPALVSSNRLYTPAFAMLTMATPRRDVWAEAWPCIVVLFAIGSTLMLLQWLLLRRAWRHHSEAKIVQSTLAPIK
jgi:RsiW-degrading membrane proteinase PrsW (M82 family)